MKQVSGCKGYTGCRQCVVVSHRISGCTGAKRSQVQQVQQQSMQQQQAQQVQTVQSLVEAQLVLNGERWARVLIEMAVSRTKAESCGKVAAGDYPLPRSKVEAAQA